MRTISLRALHRSPPTDEAVMVTRGRAIVGTFTPVGVPQDVARDGLRDAPTAVGEGVVLMIPVTIAHKPEKLDG